MVKPKDLRVEDNLKVIYIGGEVKYFRIQAVDNIFYKDAHSALAAAGTEDYSEISNLDPPADQLYYIYGIEVDGNVKVYLKQPAATNRWGTNKTPEGGPIIDIDSPLSDAKEVDIWIAEDYPPNVKIVNDTNVYITPILKWQGKRFSVMGLREAPSVFTTVRIGGIAD